MNHRVCIFASSSNSLDKIFYDDANLLGTLLGNNGFDVVYGGSRLGLMYSCVHSARMAGSKIFGVMPKIFDVAGFSNPFDCDEFYITEGMRERKAKMDLLSDSVIALSGGFGTLEEISEMIVQKQLGYNNKPIVILNTNGFYDKLLLFFEEIVNKNFAKYESKELYYVADSPENVIQYLVSYNYKNSIVHSKF